MTNPTELLSKPVI